MRGVGRHRLAVIINEIQNAAVFKNNGSSQYVRKMSDKCPLKKQMSAVTAPEDDVDTNNPNHPLSGTDWPLPSSAYGLELIPGRSEFDSHHVN